jgi:two-component system sensor histidine kinase HydH
MKTDSENKKLDKRWLSLTRFMLAAMLVLFLLVLALTTADRLRRTGELMREALVLRGNMLVDYLESATRASMRGGMARIMLLSDMAQDISEFSQLRALQIVDDSAAVLVSLNLSSPQPQDLLPELGSDNWQLLRQGQTVNVSTDDNFIMGRAFRPFAAAVNERGNRSVLNSHHGHGSPPPPPQTLMRPYSQLNPAAQMWENLAMMCMSVSQGSGNLYALVEISNQELLNQQKIDLRSALILAAIIFAGVALLTVAITWLIGQRSREMESIRRHMAENQRLAAVGRLAASVAHEVRNPLSSLRGLVQLMSKNFSAQSSEANYARVAVDEVDRLERVVSDLLNYTRPRAPRFVDLDINESLAAALAFLQDDARARGINFHCPKRDDLPKIPADPDLLRQVLLNLILNAMEAINGEGNIWIDLETEKNFLIITVKDDGPGLPAERDVFDPFFSAKPTGSGLGLAIAKNIISAHQGWLEGSNAPEGGAIMRIKLRLQA